MNLHTYIKQAQWQVQKPAQGLFQVPGITSAGTYILPLKLIYKDVIFNTNSDNKCPLSHSHLLTVLDNYLVLYSQPTIPVP